MGRYRPVKKIMADIDPSNKKADWTREGVDIPAGLFDLQSRTWFSAPQPLHFFWGAGAIETAAIHRKDFGTRRDKRVNIDPKWMMNGSISAQIQDLRVYIGPFLQRDGSILAHSQKSLPRHKFPRVYIGPISGSISAQVHKTRVYIGPKQQYTGLYRPIFVFLRV